MDEAKEGVGADVKTLRLDQYDVGARSDISDEVCRRMVECFAHSPGTQTGGLSGRARTQHLEIAAVGNIVIKHYIRGGVFGHVNNRLYFRWGKTRGEREFRILDKVRALGVNAPEPILWASRGGPFYRAWLVTRELENEGSLAEISRKDEVRARRVTEALVEQVAILIMHGIFHVDLHPGNVLVGHDDTPYLLDFDKACAFPREANKLRDAYLYRWRRAVIKHELPEILSEIACLGLRKSYERKVESCHAS